MSKGLSPVIALLALLVFTMLIAATFSFAFVSDADTSEVDKEKVTNHVKSFSPEQGIKCYRYDNYNAGGLSCVKTG